MRRFAAGVVVVLAVLVGAAVLGAEPLLNSEAVRGRVAAGVERTTGHAVRLGGRIELGAGSLLALSPVVGVRDVALLNGPGFSREVLASVRLVEAKLALLPLLVGRVEVRSVMLVGPDVLLERDAAGRGNWERPVAPQGVEPGVEAGSSGSRARVAVEVASMRVINGRLEWRGAPVVEVPVLTFAPSAGVVEGQFLVNGVELAVGGEMRGAGGPFEVTATGGGVVLAVSGTGGGDFGFRGTAERLEAASGLVGRSLPASRNVVVSGQVGPGGVSGMHLEAGETGLGVPGLRLLQLKMDVVDVRQPAQVLATGAFHGLPIALVGSFGPLDRLGGTASRTGGVPVAVQITADGGTAGVQGVIDWAARTMEGTVSARVPDMGRTGGLAGFAVPGVRDLAVDVRVAPGPGGAVLLRGLRVGSAQGDVAGDLAIGWAPRPSVRGSLVSNRLVLDVPPAAAPVVGTPVVGTPVWGAQAGADSSAALARPLGLEAGHPALSDRALPFEWLRAGDGDVRWVVGEAVYRGVTYRGIEVRGLLQEGRLRVDPLRMAGPGGVIEGQAVVDASVVPPTVAVTVRAAGMDAGVMMEGVTGAVEMDVALRAVGSSPHALAGSLMGHAAMALVEGEIENAELAWVFGGVLRGANLPLGAGGGEAAGRSRVRCMAMRMEAEGGQVRVTTLALDATRLRMEGDGVVDLGGETMDVHLRPVIRIGGTGVAVPVRVVGPWRAPKPSADRGVVAPGRFGLSIGAPAADTCGPALVAVRAP